MLTALTICCALTQAPLLEDEVPEAAGLGRERHCHKLPKSMATLRYFQVVVNFGSLPQPPQTQKKTPNEQHESHLVQKLEILSPNHSGTPIEDTA